MSADPSLRQTLAKLKPMIAGRGLAAFVGSFLVVALLETVAVSLLPAFVASLADPQARLARSGPLGALLPAGAGGAQIVIALGAVTAAFFVLKNLLIAWLSWFQARYVAERQQELSERLLAVYLRQPYTFHLQRNTGDLSGYVTASTLNIFTCVVLPGSIVVTELLVAALVTGLLLAVSPLVTLLAVGVIGGASLAFYGLFRAPLRRLGEQQQAQRSAMFRWIAQALGGIKETIILGRQRFFVEAYARLLAAYSRPFVVLQTVGTLQRLFVETAVVCGMVLVVIALSRSEARFEVVFPTLALFGVAALRLMPSATRIVGALTTIRFYQPSVDVVAAELAAGGGEPAPAPVDAPRAGFKREIEARALGYTYEGAAKPALRDVSLRIRKGGMVAFVGRSGAGKSTLVDMLLGLHLPSSGSVRVDGRDIAADVGAWQRNIGYVPQAIFLTDDTLRRNVAFGLRDAEIDDAGVLRALEAAQLGEFVRGLPRGLDSVVGERGARLSGGQRQRIGIARALYRDPEVLVLDEPTSALDSATAGDVASVLGALAGRKTILLIAHRMASVRLCERIFLLRDGALVAEGGYDALAAAHPEFQALVD